MREFVYPVKLTPDKQDGGYVVSFRDLPEAITQGDTCDDALDEAAGALEAAIEGRIMDGLSIPLPTKAKRGEQLVAVPVHAALKAALYLAMRDAGITQTELAKRLHIDEKEARRMLDPRHSTRADRLEKALAALGKQAKLRVA